MWIEKLTDTTCIVRPVPPKCPANAVCIEPQPQPVPCPQ
jgi:hypothetical protein